MGNIELIIPTTRAYERMKRVLFEPFDIKKWFLLGFSAWLAALADGGGGGNGLDGGNIENWDGSFDGGWERWFHDNTLLAVAIIIGVCLIVLFILALVIALLWVSSRGKFMFLDNLVHDRTLISQPWKEFRQIANSLFIWRLLIGFGAMLVIFGIGAGAVLAIFALAKSSEIAMWVVIGVMLLVLLLLILALSYITVMLEEFVIPIMYKERIKTLPAVRRFLSLHGQHLPDFIIYFIWIILLWIGVMLGLVVLGLVTCCVGFLLMIIPYLGTVFLLPVAVFFRYLGPEFIRQYGPEFDILIEREPPPVS
jgi:hypothetical protein